jgi:hypothetical protein
MDYLNTILDGIVFWGICIKNGACFSWDTFGVIDLACGAIGAIFLLLTEERLKKWEKMEVSVRKYAILIILIQLGIGVIIVAPYNQYKAEKRAKDDALATLNDKSPKLDGFIDQWMIFVRAGETNTTIVTQIHINNYGGSGSLAENFKLKLLLATNDLVEAKPIDIPDYYQWQEIIGGQITVFRLSRPDLISEKTSTAIERGFGPRGWLAFKAPRILSQNQLSNISFVISFSDVAGNENYITNGFRRGKALTNSEAFDIPKTLDGSVNLVYTNYQIQSEMASGWLPPELPADCTNVVIYLGTDAMPYSRFMAQISPVEGTKFAIKDVPDFFLTGYENSPDYDPSRPDMRGIMPTAQWRISTLARVFSA